MLAPAKGRSRTEAKLAVQYTILCFLFFVGSEHPNYIITKRMLAAAKGRSRTEAKLAVQYTILCFFIFYFFP